LQSSHLARTLNDGRMLVSGLYANESPFLDKIRKQLERGSAGSKAR